MGAKGARLSVIAAYALLIVTAEAQQSSPLSDFPRSPYWAPLPPPNSQSVPRPGAVAPPAPYMDHMDSELNPATRPRLELRTIKDVFLSMELCWRANLPSQPVPGMTVRILVSFSRWGEMFGEPKFTFKTPGVPADTANLYQRAAAAALARCNPLPFSDGLGNAVAGRPFVFDFVDRRTQRGT